jgi:signal transduction histidine kinase/ligand-binding sensor domain-containing protein/DNA-binding response OmpR family regulator
MMLYVFMTSQAGAYNLYQLSNKEGLSNSAILSICQDNERFIWIGTADGLNLYNGADISIFKPGKNSKGNLSGNLIEEVWEGEKGIIWINTNHGLNRYDKKTQKTDRFNEFEGKYYCATTDSNDVFVVHENSVVDYYDRNSNKFVHIPYSKIVINDIQRVFIDNDDVLWVVTNKGAVHTAKITFTAGVPELNDAVKLVHDSDILYAFREKQSVYFIDYASSLYELQTSTDKKIFISNIRKQLEERGEVSSIIRDNDDYLVAFKTNGLIRLQNTPEKAVKYEVRNIEIYCGVFCLLKDEQQDIIWIGADGQGLFMYTRDMFSIRSVTFENLHFSIQKPVRAIFADRECNLWVGTKDDGILLIHDYSLEENIQSRKTDHITTVNSALSNNSIYTFAESSRNLLWIGGDGSGLNYYSYRDRKIRKIASASDEQIVFVHDICEVNDTTLWLSSVGAGVYKVILTGKPDEPVIKSVKRYTFIKDEMSYNFFFTSCRENDSIIWFGNRGYGLQRLNLNTETFENIQFSQNDVRTINDILSLYKDRDGFIWAGTSFGIVKITGYDSETKNVEYINYNEIEGLPNNTIHGIRQDDHGYLWISTNGGLVRFDAATEKFRLYNSNNGLNVFEFSDGAYHKDAKSGALYFGGINGFVSIMPDVFEQQDFVPGIYFTGLKIYEKEYNINDFMTSRNGRDVLQLRYDQNFFSISFIASDYVNGQNCKYSYNLENFNDLWIENGRANSASFTNIAPGKYTLNVRSDNGDVATGVYSLPVVILPPWYMTVASYVIYALMFIATVLYSVRTVRKTYRHKRESMIENMSRQQKEEIYESKLRFFTNITHEFSTPLTLIYGPCDRIMSYEKSDDFIKKYSGMIMKNTERLYSLIQELIEFRRIETGHKECVIEKLNISAISADIIETFTELSEDRNIEYKSDIEEEINWNTDQSCYTKILSNLLSNAFKYTPDGGTITVSINGGNSKLLNLKVSNTGKGIEKKDIPYIFDRYRVLDNLEKQTKKGFFSRNGLGLAICHNMVRLLDGDITVRSVPNTFTEFDVTIPSKEATMSSASKAIKVIESAEYEDTAAPPNQSPPKSKDSAATRNQTAQRKLNVFVIDDDPEMCWFISEIMSEKYTVTSIKDPLTVAGILETVQPQLIISDIMMPGMDGITLMKRIKADRRTQHIPFILLSARNTPEEQTEGINAGAEAYVIKPFNVEYLLSLTDRLLKRQHDLKDYYNSPISAYELSEGKYVHKDNKSFYDKIMQVIDSNISNPDFSTKHLAQELGLSSRHLYRRLLEITNKTPSTLIKDYKLTAVEKMLTTSRDSVEEIMYKAGFNNRGSFYSLFTKKYGTTPKKYRDQKINNGV